MRTISRSILTTIALALTACPQQPQDTTPLRPESVWQPTPGLGFEWQLTGTPDFSIAADVYDLDWERTTAEQVSQLHALGRKVVCYVNVGAWQPDNSDNASFDPAWLGLNYEGTDFAEERYLDVRQEGVREIMRKRIETCKTKGFDAIEPDNMDAPLLGERTGFPLTEADAVNYALFLAQTAHDQGLAILQKNTPDLVSQLIDAYDGALLESCYGVQFCDDFKPYVDAGKVVFDVEYVDGASEGNLTAAAFQASCTDTRFPAYASFTRILKYRDLRPGIISSCP